MLNLRFLISFGILGFPIAATLGILIALNLHSEATYGHPLFTGSPDSGAVGGGGGSTGGGSSTGDGSKPPVNNDVTRKQYCQKTVGITPASKGQQYTLNPNQWGWKEGTSGSLCLNITTFNNMTYPTDTSAPHFSVTWQYPQGPESQPVHAFPNIQLQDTKVLPVALSDLSKLDIGVSWTYGVGNVTATQTAPDATLSAQALNANVAFDMFLDSDKKAAADTAQAKYEVMVWLADFGPATQPLGLTDGAVATETINGTTFTLYYGQNGQKQNVLTWVAKRMTNTLVGDISPLIAKLVSLDNTNFPVESDYLGYVGFGSEALFVNEFVTFDVPKLSMKLEKS